MDFKSVWVPWLHVVSWSEIHGAVAEETKKQFVSNLYSCCRSPCVVWIRVRHCLVWCSSIRKPWHNLFAAGARSRSQPTSLQRTPADSPCGIPWAHTVRNICVLACSFSAFANRVWPAVMFLNEDSSSTGHWSTSSLWLSWRLWRKVGWVLSILQPLGDMPIALRSCSKPATIQTSCCTQGCAAAMMMSAGLPSSSLCPTMIFSALACC